MQLTSLLFNFLTHSIDICQHTLLLLLKCIDSVDLNRPFCCVQDCFCAPAWKFHQNNGTYPSIRCLKAYQHLVHSNNSYYKQKSLNIFLRKGSPWNILCHKCMQDTGRHARSISNVLLLSDNCWNYAEMPVRYWLYSILPKNVRCSHLYPLSKQLLQWSYMTHSCV